jgi:PAS domain S-box-containing protein
LSDVAAEAGFLVGGGEMGAMIRAHDWSTSPLGDPAGWPQSLRSVVGLILGSKFPMFVAWGPELGFLYNDAYAEILGAKHPKALGRPFQEIWSEIWSDIWPLVDAALAGQATYMENMPLVMNRKGYDEQTWFTFSYSPVRDESGEVAGMFCACNETTAQLTAEQELRESEARYRTLFDKIESGFCVVEVKQADADGPTDYRVVEANPAFYAETGFPPEILGQWLREAAPALEEHWYEAYGRVARTGRSERFRQGSELLGRWFDVIAFTPSGGPDERVAILFEDISRDQEAEAALRTSEERLRLATEHAEIGFWDVDMIADRLIWPARVKAMFGISPDVPVSMDDFYNGLHPDDREHVSAAFAEAADPEKRALYDVEYRTVGKEDGIVRWVAAKGRGLFEDGKCVRVIGTAIDISARKATEEALRQLNETLEQRVAEGLAERRLLAELVETTDAFVQVADKEYRWLAINKAAADEIERIFGIRPKVGDSILEALAHLPDQQAAAKKVWDRALAGEEFTETAEFGDPGRDRRYYEMKYHVLRDSSGEQIGAYQFVNDVTERVSQEKRLAEAEAARREADRLYRAYFNNSPEALFVIEVTEEGDFVVEQTNPTHERAVGMKMDDVRGRRIEDLLPPEAARKVIESYRHVVETGEIHQYREVFDLGGDPRHWDTSIVPLREPGGRISRLIGSSRDVTGQVTAEEKLRESQKMEAMGKLTGGVAHDFNNLLTPIIGGLDMLQRKRLGSEREQKLIGGAMQSAERAKTLVQRLLAFARRQPLQSVPVDLGKLVGGLSELVASTTGPQIKVMFEAEEGLPAALADPNQLEMAILNLSVNARDAMREGGTLRISASAAEVEAGHGSGLKPGAYVKLSVADTGEGMDEAVLARAVEPFFSTKGIGKGTGLGLSMVHGLASQLGGALTIHSRPGLGTNVELWLPQSQAAPAETDGTGAEACVIPGGQGIALLVDDEALVRLSTADMLNDLGYRVIEAASAEEAIRLIDRGERFDLLVTDHLMPGMNGTDLARAVRGARPDVPVLLVSGYAESEGIAPDLPRLVKPFRKDELAASLYQISN